MNSKILPQHVAIIMDGNGRWAKQHKFNRVKGHEKGSETVRMIVRTCRQLGIKVLTLYAFSTENWQRSKIEVTGLMHLLNKFLLSEQQEMLDQGIRLNVIGQIERLPMNVKKTLAQTMSVTSHNTAMLLNLALSYGSRAEIVTMTQKIATKVQSQEIQADAINEATVSEHLYTCGMPDPDLLIRTSGEMRISNFLLWQIAYAEIFITKTLWPDFTKAEFIEILETYQKRDRRFGGRKNT